MSMSRIMAQVVAVVGGAALRVRRLRDAEPVPAWGGTPLIPEAKPQGKLPTLKMPTAQGWSAGHKPTTAPGLKVNAFASGLKHPRWIQVMPTATC
jgi:glucose/arabinose dehydrogenase